VVENELTDGYSIGQQVLQVSDSDAWLYADALLSDVVVLAISADNPNLVAVAVREVPRAGSVVFFGPNQVDQDDFAALEDLIRNVVE
jgi:hypothetical protein